MPPRFKWSAESLSTIKTGARLRLRHASTLLCAIDPALAHHVRPLGQRLSSIAESKFTHSAHSHISPRQSKFFLDTNERVLQAATNKETHTRRLSARIATAVGRTRSAEIKKIQDSGLATR